jgi:hypothetical protein
VDILALNDAKYTTFEKIRFTQSNNIFMISSKLAGVLKTPLVTNKWTCLELNYSSNSTGNEIAYWVDGVMQGKTNSPTWTNQLGILDLGILRFDALTNGLHLYIDDVVFALNPANVDSSISSDTNTVGLGGSNQVKPHIVIIHPDFQGRIGTRLLAVITGNTSGDKMVSTLRKPDGASNIVYNGTVPIDVGKCYIDVDIKGGIRGQYSLETVLLDSNGNPKCSETILFTKAYDGDPRFTLDANNIFYLDNKKVFPVTPFGLDASKLGTWGASNYINMAYGQGWYNPTPATMRSYVVTAKAVGLPTIGPLNMGAAVRNGSPGALTTSTVISYVTNLTHVDDLIAYSLRDEPDYNGFTAADHKEWWDVVKKFDPSKLTHVNLMGTDFITNNDANVSLGHTFTYPYLIADIYGFDYYPMWGSNKTLGNMVMATRNLIRWNYNLVPVWGFVQTANVENGNSASREPTASEVNLMAWLLVIGGCHGVQWYHYQGITPPANFDAMAKFTKDVTDLTDVIYSDDIVDKIAFNSVSQMFTMARCYSNNIYLFVANPAYSEGTAMFSFSKGLPYANRMYIYNQSEPVMSEDGNFIQTIPPLGVRIFIAQNSNTTGNPATNQAISAPENLRVVPQ